MERNRNWFFSGQPGISGVRFLKGNKPTEATFRDLLDSIPLFTEAGDTASSTRQGLVKVSTDAHAYGRSNISGIQEAVMPWQLPNLELSADGGSTHTEAIYGGSTVQAGGLLLKPIAVTRGSNTALNFVLAFDPGNLAIKATESAADYMVIYDAATGLPKRLSMSGFSSNGMWTLDGSIIIPNGAYTLDVAPYSLTSGSHYLDATTDRVISMQATSGATGKSLKIEGSSLSGGGVYAGGSVYLYGGAGVGGGDYGNTLLAFNGSNAIGNVGVGGSASATHRMRINGNLHVTGTIIVDGMAGSGSGIGNLDNAGTFSHITYAVARTNIFPAGTDGKVLVYNTSDWTAVAVTGDISIDKNGLTAIGTGVVVDADINASAGIQISKTVGPTKNCVLVTNASTGIVEESTVVQEDLNLLEGLNAYGVTLNDLKTIKGIYDVMIINTDGVEMVTGKYFLSAGGFSEKVRTISVLNETLTDTDQFIILEMGATATTLNLPDVTLRDGMVIKIIVTKNATPSNLILDAYGTQAISYAGAENATATITTPAVNKTIYLIGDSVAGVWSIGV